MVQPQFIFQLTGIDETYVSHWFIKEGEPVRSSAPLVTLRHLSGMAFTLRAPLAGPLRGAILQQILLPERSSVSASDVLAVLTKTAHNRSAVEHLGALKPETSLIYAEMDVDLIPTSSSRIRDTLFKWSPFHYFYFRTYPLLPLLTVGCIATVGVLIAQQIHRLLTQELGTLVSPDEADWFLSLAQAVLIALIIGIFATLVLTAVRLYFLGHYRRRHRVPPGSSGG